MAPFTSPESMVRAAVLRRLLRDESVDPPALSATTGLTLVTVAEALGRLNAAGAIYLSNGSVTAAYPLSAVPTRHKILHDGATSFACCAIDALAVPSMIDGPATIESRCAYCDRDVKVQMRGDQVLSSHPEVPVVFHADRDCCESGPTVLVRCPRINFFCGSDHVNRWLAENPGLTGDTLTLDQGVIRAREIFAPTVRLVRDESRGHSVRE